MPPVTLHQPAEGLDRGDTYSGPNEDWLVANGYASRGKDADGLHSTTVEIKNDPMDPRNREAAGEEPPTPKKEITVVEENPEVYQRPEVPEATDSTQPNQKAIDKMRSEVEDEKRDENVPNVVLEDARKALDESRDYDGSEVEAIRSRQERTLKTEDEARAKYEEQRAKDALKAAAQERKDQQLGGEHKAPDEDRAKESGVGTDGKSETTAQTEWPLLPELPHGSTAGKEASAKQESKKATEPKKAAAKKDE